MEGRVAGDNLVANFFRRLQRRHRGERGSDARRPLLSLSGSAVDEASDSWSAGGAGGGGGGAVDDMDGLLADSHIGSASWGTTQLEAAGTPTVAAPSGVSKPGRGLASRRWTCIAKNNPYELTLPQETIAMLAEKARAVVIRSTVKHTKCVVSRDDSDPILRLRMKKDMSQSNMDGLMIGGDCPEKYIVGIWEGIPHDLQRLQVRWGDDRGNPYGLKRMYWACCNNGLHFLPGNDSGWYFQRAADIEILIDAAPPSSAEMQAMPMYRDAASLPDLERQMPNTEGLWDVLQWDAGQLQIFAGIFGGGNWIKLRKLLKDAYGERATAKFVLTQAANIKSMIFGMLSKRIEAGTDVPDLGLEVIPMLRTLRLLLVVEGYRLQGTKFLEELEDIVDAQGKRLRSPAWKGERIAEIQHNGNPVLPGKLAQLALDDSDGEFYITARIKTTHDVGTIFTRTFPDGMWYDGGKKGQPKILFLNEGVVCFAIGRIGFLRGRTRVDDGEEHLVGLKLSPQGEYLIMVDGEIDQIDTEPLFVVRDHPTTIFAKEVSVAVKDKAILDEVKALHQAREPGGAVHGLDEPWFWQPRDRYVVGVSVVVTDVSEVDAVSENVSIKFQLALSWHDDALCDWSKSDAEYVDFDAQCEKLEPHPYFENAVEEPIIANVFRRRDVCLGRIVTTFYCAGTFYDPVDVHDFPFDKQEFDITIRVREKSLSVQRQLVPVSPFAKDIASYTGQYENPEWDINQPTATFSRDGAFKLTISSQRKAGYYLLNVVLPLFLIASLSFSAFAVPAGEFADRFSVLGSVLLATVAFRFTYSDSTPKVSYQTWLDTYVLNVTIFLFSLTFLVFFVTCHMDPMQSVELSWLPDWVTADHMTGFAGVATWGLLQESLLQKTCQTYVRGFMSRFS